MMFEPRIVLIVNAFTTQFLVDGQTLLITDTAELARALTGAMMECRHKDGNSPVRLEIEAHVPLRV